MLPLFVLQLKVLREHQVNIHWLTSTVRNLINMSSGCLLTVSFNALPTHTPTHMNKVQAHTHTHACTLRRQIHVKRTHSRKCTHKEIPVHTHARTHAHALPSQPSRGSQQAGSADRLSQNNVSNSVTSAIISTTESEQIGSAAVQLNKSRLLNEHAMKKTCPCCADETTVCSENVDKLL